MAKGIRDAQGFRLRNDHVFFGRSRIEKDPGSTRDQGGLLSSMKGQGKLKSLPTISTSGMRKGVK